ncbi:RDD family protein [Halobacillus locisalis]|uniref:RDD family protein n=1 Tax=Halobacillus locisalis TaxID=220753 RepID=A0A838CPG7_9BACI|nr:RDD family protein [Halobacillus locisalis]MBA2173748.1 RDD family protein [Halobacillus locisalis]
MDERAGFWDRLGASLLDGVIVGILFSIIGYVVHGEINNEEYNITDLLNLLYLVLIPVIWKGYTIGKRILKIRIVRKSGQNVGLWTMVLRAVVGGLVYAFTFGIGLIVSAFMVGLREDKRAIHDFIAGTYVKKERRI